jgi:HK97 gp10 family phage protein
MAKVTLKLEGFEATRRALVAAPERARVHASSAVAASTFAVTQRSRSLVPVDTGRLKNAIGSTRVVSGLQGQVGITDADAYYWRFVEFGTINMAARPFFRPAAEEERNVFIQRMRDIGPRIERDLSTGRFV